MFQMPCPYCGRPNDRSLGATGGTGVPMHGDVAVCFGCLEPGVFANGPFGIAIRLPTAEERAQIDADPEYQLAVLTVRNLRARKRAHPEG